MKLTQNQEWQIDKEASINDWVCCVRGSEVVFAKLSLLSQIEKESEKRGMEKIKELLLSGATMQKIDREISKLK